jgi:hypothetical protein
MSGVKAGYTRQLVVDVAMLHYRCNSCAISVGWKKCRYAGKSAVGTAELLC